MRFKTASIIIMTVFLVLILGFFWQTKETQRISADLIQLGKEQKVQPSSLETEDVVLSLVDGMEEVVVGQKVVYTISYSIKQDLKGVRIVGTLGSTKQKIYPNFAFSLGNLKAGTSGSFSVPITIESGETNFAVSRITISEMKKPNWWSKESRTILATVDDINKLLVQ